MIVIVDYGMGNLGSIANMLKKLGKDAIISASDADIMRADKLILPGVGKFDEGMANLRERNLIGMLNQRVVDERTPILGVCLGMQLLTESSEEGGGPGLGWIKAQTIKFQPYEVGSQLKIPHMGWNYVTSKLGCALWDKAGCSYRYYFVHSYHVVCADRSHIVGTAVYGHEFVAAIAFGHIAGVQFHPEKSHRYGMELLKRFAEDF